MKINRGSITSMAVVAFMVGMLGLTTPSTADESEAAATVQKSVLVTGASRGIGLKITEVLAKRGVHVWAGARKEADLKMLDAMEAYGDSLAREMAKFDVKVSLVEPGNYKSQIGQSLKKRMESKGITFEDSRYKDEIEAIVSSVGERSDEKDPEEVAEAVYQALFSDNPKMRYMVVPDQEEAGWTIGKAIQELVQLNEGQPYTYGRDTLVNMLDEALKE